MKVLGLDLGNKTLGVAISDEMKFLARDIETVRFSHQAFNQAIEYVVTLCQKEPIDTIVLGFPKNMDNTEGEQAKITKQFKADLEEATNLPVILVDERLSSKSASQMMKTQKLKRKKRQKSIDQMAATIILQSYLDRNE
ncbi:MAG: Holliday junction resolvase RuvX [Candidatus Izemoplasma sp.]|nr:Holliday junction resolvase RuvX [Candidatus Izemoplasma sp.]